MSELVEISSKELEKLVAIAQIQEDGRYFQGSTLRLALGECLSEADGCSGRELAKKLEKVTKCRCYSGYRPKIGDIDVNGERVGADYRWNMNKPIDLSPVGQGSIYGKILLELAKRIENGNDLLENQRVRAGRFLRCDPEA